jgi:hypothetical protein
MGIHVNMSPAANQYGGANEKIIEYSQSGTGAGGLISFSVDAAGRLVVNLYRHESLDAAPTPEIKVNGVTVPSTVVRVHRAPESMTWDVASPRGVSSATPGVVADLVWEEIGNARGAVVLYQDEDSMAARLARRSASQDKFTQAQDRLFRHLGGPLDAHATQPDQH